MGSCNMSVNQSRMRMSSLPRQTAKDEDHGVYKEWDGRSSRSSEREVDMMWPRRKKSDLMVQHSPIRHVKPDERRPPKPVKIEIQRQGKKPTGGGEIVAEEDCLGYILPAVF